MIIEDQETSQLRNDMISVRSISEMFLENKQHLEELLPRIRASQLYHLNADQEEKDFIDHVEADLAKLVNLSDFQGEVTNRRALRVLNEIRD